MSLSRTFLPIVALIALLSYLLVYMVILDVSVIRSDGWGYYSYLPALGIFHDPSFEALARDCCGGEFPVYTAWFRWPETGRWMNAHPIGEALLVLPFFLVADWLTQWSNLSRDGFSLYYQYLSGLAGVVYFVVGLWLLKRLLERDFSDGVVLATLVSITWGTNLFHYGTFDTMFSHAFAFFACAALLIATRHFYQAPSWRSALLLGCIAGLTMLIRHTNAVILLCVPLYGITTRETARRIGWIRKRWHLLVVAAAALFLVFFPQSAFYYYATGHWLVNPYGSNFGGFNFTSPRILAVLFSPQKGLLFWSPILVLSIVGFFSARQRVPEFYLASLLVITVELLMVASWYDWQFGSSYGHRAFTDLLPLFAIGMAAFYDRVRATQLAKPVTSLASLLIALSVIQMLQYWVGILPQQDTSWEQYTSLFLNFHR
jgi:hypothetical protein